MTRSQATGLGLILVVASVIVLALGPLGAIGAFVGLTLGVIGYTRLRNDT
jgi:heme O synthase-like polyprenyltransferase